ncbi:MAG: acyl-CoA dehydrogenase family protein [Chloroflexota bacterium]|nr:MAG: acyl-CoA dehydrogenase family protein [Chloroflexota bacterium]
MYAFEPSEEQRMLIDAIQRYTTNDLRPAAHDADETNQLPNNLIEKGWELGVLQASVPEEYGGFGDHSSVTGVLAAEELAWGDLAGAFAVLSPGLFALPILLAGNEEQKAELIPPVIEDEWKPFTAALIEPRFDFDPFTLHTTATENQDGFVLNGEKVFVPFAADAEKLIIYADLNGQSQGFIVSAGAQGLHIGDRQSLMGINAFPLYKVKLDGLRIPKSNRLGGQDGADIHPIIDASRVAVAAAGVGISRAAYEYSRDYAKDRDVFGVKVAQKQAIAFMLAEMATEIEAIRLLTWEAAWMLDVGKEEASKYAYLAHTGAMDMAMMVTDRAVQILGGHGYIREHPVEMWMRCGRGIATFTGLAMV